MPVWYEVEKTEKGIRDFLQCNWGFHDFTIDRAVYHRKSRTVELFMRYDALQGSVMLRFLGVRAMYIAVPENDCIAWLSGSTLVLSGGCCFVWIASDDSADIESMKQNTTWIEAEQIIWAVTDAQGNPAEMPAHKLDQTWTVFGKTEQHHFAFKPFAGDVPSI